eukprot:scaffold41831_cov73-Phaeocystis_antarctica.AAC.2
MCARPEIRAVRSPHATHFSTTAPRKFDKGKPARRPNATRLVPMLRLVTYLSLLAGARAYQSAAGRLPTIESRVSLGRPAMFGGMKLGAALDAAGDHYLAKPAPPPQVCGNSFAPSTSHPSRRTLLLGALGTAVAVGNAKPASAGSFNAASTDQASDQVTVGLEGDYFSNYWSAKPDLEGGSEQLVSWKFKGTVPRVRIYLRRKKLGLSSYTLLASDIENTGSCVVTLPSGPGFGTYFLQIESMTDDRVYEWSRKFTIDKTATPAVIYDVVAKPQPPSTPPTQRGKVKKSLVPGASY